MYLFPMETAEKHKITASPAAYLKNTRVSKAKTYLLTTELSVDDIPELCGFCNTSHFIRA